MVVKVYDICVVCSGCKHKQKEETRREHQCNKNYMDAKQSAQIQVEHNYANNVTLSRSHSDLNNIVADEGFDDAYTDDSDDCCALGTKQPSIPRNMRRHTVKFQVLANALATCKNCTNSPHDFHKTIRSCCHFKGKLHVFNSYDGSFNAGL